MAIDEFQQIREYPEQNMEALQFILDWTRRHTYFTQQLNFDEVRSVPVPSVLRYPRAYIN